MKQLVCLSLLLLLAASCEKRLFDHRNKYTGNYRMTVEYREWNINQGSTDTTWTYDGRVWYLKKDGKCSLHFTYSNSAEFVCTVDRKGRIYYGPEEDRIGRFRDRENFSFTWTSSGLGGGVEYTITGKRK